MALSKGERLPFFRSICPCFQVLNFSNNILQFDVIILCLSWFITRFRQYGLPYDSSQPYDGKEFTDVLSAMDTRQIKLTLKSAYRKDGKKVKKIIAKYTIYSSTY